MEETAVVTEKFSISNFSESAETLKAISTLNNRSAIITNEGEIVFFSILLDGSKLSLKTEERMFWQLDNGKELTHFSLVDDTSLTVCDNSTTCRSLSCEKYFAHIVLSLLHKRLRK